MDPKFQTSFIPKRSVDSGTISSSFSPVSVRQNMDMLTSIAVLVFAVSVLTLGGFFGYKYYLNKQIVQIGTEIDAARAAFQPEKIRELIDANARLISVSLLLDKHVAVSQALSLMQNLIVKKMRFVNLSYSDKGISPGLLIKGQVESYNALASQQEIFSQNESIKNPKFFNFNLDQNGYIDFEFSGSLNKNSVNYSKIVQGDISN